VPRGGHEYDLIPAGEELRTWVELMAVWGQRDFPDRNRVWRVEQDGEWVEPGNSAIVNPRGEFVAGPVAHEKTILLAEIDVSQVHARRRKFDSVGHYNHPDVFRLSIDASERRAVDALNWSDKIKRELEH
jgi:hypothetical protein